MHNKSGALSTNSRDNFWPSRTFGSLWSHHLTHTNITLQSVQLHFRISSRKTSHLTKQTLPSELNSRIATKEFDTIHSRNIFLKFSSYRLKQFSLTLFSHLLHKQKHNEVMPRLRRNTKAMETIKINGAKTAKLYFGNASNRTRSNSAEIQWELAKAFDALSVACTYIGAKCSAKKLFLNFSFDFNKGFLACITSSWKRPYIRFYSFPFLRYFNTCT